LEKGMRFPQENMSDEPQPAPEPQLIMGLGRAATIGTVLLALYVLSAGPVGKLAGEKVIPTKVLRIYIPLETLDEIPFVHDVWEWYLYHLWQFPCARFPSGWGVD
jgi:hypothetical protein